MKRYKRIVFVDESDTAKAPMAQGALEQFVIDGEYEIEGKGLVVLFPEPVNEKAEAVMISNGIRHDARMSEQLKEEDFDEDSLIIPLEDGDYEFLTEKFGEKENVAALSQLIKEPVDYGELHGKTLADYGLCFEKIQADMEKLSQVLKACEKDDKEAI